MNLKQFRADIGNLMIEETERPFVCGDSPLNASVFIVGFNPATTLEKSFWSYWNDVTGFNRELFNSDYSKLRTKRGNRPRIEAIAAAFSSGTCLETNIYSSPTKTAAMLRPEQRRTAVFEYLYNTVKPKALYIHSVPAVEFFSKHNPRINSFDDDVATPTTILGRDVVVMLRRKSALYTMAVDDAKKCGRALAEAVSTNS
jgi:hypothetical protein